MISEMATIARECFKHPRYPSIHSTELDRFICLGDPGYQEALQQHKRTQESLSIEPAFKLVFVTAAIGTGFCLLLCTLLTLLGRHDAPGLLDHVVTALLDLLKIGFGAIVGLLGGQVLRSRH